MNHLDIIEGEGGWGSLLEVNNSFKATTGCPKISYPHSICQFLGFSSIKMNVFVVFSLCSDYAYLKRTTGILPSLK